MSYYINTVVETSFDDAVLKVTEHLKNEGFGVLTEINVQKTLKNKIDVDFRLNRGFTTGAIALLFGLPKPEKHFAPVVKRGRHPQQIKAGNV